MFDNEDEILSFARDYIRQHGALHFNGNSFNKKVQRCLTDVDNLVSDNGHDALPPDYYSDTHNMMFDVLRVNDSEIKKRYNPVKIRERNAYNEILEKFGDIMQPNTQILTISESDDIDEHIYKNYTKNAKRVIGEHIKKINKWKNKHPCIKHKGLFIFDETEVYFEGVSKPTGSSNPDEAWFRAVNAREGFHKPWLDQKFMKQIYESELDFIVWFCPWKPDGVVRQIRAEFPYVVIIDVRFPFDDYIIYSDDLVC